MHTPYLNEAIEALARRELEEVLAHLARFWERMPKGHAVLAEECLAARRYDLAEAHGEAFAVSVPEPADAHALAMRFAERGLLQMAEKLLTASALQDPEVWNDLGVVQWGLRRRLDSIASLERALAIDPSHVEAKENLAQVRASVSPGRILALSDARSPHTQRYVRFFAQAGYDVHLLSEVWEDIPGVTVHAPSSPVPVHRLKEWVAIVQDLIRTIRPEVVHGHYASIYGLWGALSGFHPYFLTIWGSDINVDPHQSTKHLTLVRFALLQADLIIGQSNDLIANAQTLVGGVLQGPHRLSYGTDTEKFRPGLDSTSLKERLGLGDGPVILSPRQFKPAANIHRIIEAVPAVLAHRPDVQFVLTTVLTPHDAYYQRLCDLIDRLGVGASVHLLDGVSPEEMPLLYNLAAMTLTVRDADGGPHTIQESLACLTPVIGSDLPSYREMFGPDGGLIVNPHEAGAIARAILTLLDDPVMAAEMSRRGQARILAVHDRTRNMTRLSELYTHWIEQRAAFRSPVFEWQARAIRLSHSERHAEAMAALDIAAYYAQTPWEQAHVKLTEELLLPGEPQRLQAAIAQIVAAPQIQGKAT